VLKDKEWIFINTKGEPVLTNVSTDKIYDFKDGYAIIRQGDLVGFMNTKGEIVVPVKFKKAFNFENGYAKVLENDKWGLVDSSRKYFVITDYSSDSNLYNGKGDANLSSDCVMIMIKVFIVVPRADKT